MRFGTENLEDRVHPSPPAERASIRDVLVACARPRLTGSAGAEEVGADLRARFEKLGYTVHELPFGFSSIPGRYAVSAAGAVLVISALGAAWLAALHRGGSALAVLALAGGLLGLLAVFSPRLTRLPWGRLEAANWLVHRPGARPRYIIAAHRDSKSQPVPLHVRAGGVALALGAWGALALLGLVAALGPAGWALGPAAWLLGGAGVAAGLVLLFSWAGNASPGALDNASGVAALVALAARERDRDDVAFLVTEGEELGLVGARAACRQLPPVFGVINLDGLDDRGEFHIIERHGIRRRGYAPHLVAALLTAAEALGIPARRRHLPLGILLDHVPLVEAGFPAVTVMRGDGGSLRRVHRPTDHVAQLTGEGCGTTVALVSGALRALRAEAARA